MSGYRITLANRDTHDQHEWAFCMAFDAFRVCMGGEPRNFTREEIALWMTLCNQRPSSERETAPPEERPAPAAPQRGGENLWGVAHAGSQDPPGRQSPRLK